MNMNQVIRTLFILFLCGLLLTTQWSCARIMPGEPIGMGIIGVTTAQFFPELDDPAVTNLGQGGSRGRGADFPMLGGPTPGAMVVGLAFMAALALLLLLAYGAGKAFDALFDRSGESQEVLKSSKDDPNLQSRPQEYTPQENRLFFIQNVLASLRMQETFRDTVVTQARNYTPYTFVLVPQYGPKSIRDSPGYHEIAGQEPDTILELMVISVGLKDGEGGDDHQLSLSMKVRARLVQLVQDRVINDQTFFHRSEQRTFKEWAEDNGQPFQKAITTAYEDLAYQVIQSIFREVWPPLLG